MSCFQKYVFYVDPFSDMNILSCIRYINAVFCTQPYGYISLHYEKIEKRLILFYTTCTYNIIIHTHCIFLLHINCFPEITMIQATNLSLKMQLAEEFPGKEYLHTVFHSARHVCMHFTAAHLAFILQQLHT